MWTINSMFGIIAHFLSFYLCILYMLCAHCIIINKIFLIKLTILNNITYTFPFILLLCTFYSVLFNNFWQLLLQLILLFANRSILFTVDAVQCTTLSRCCLFSSYIYTLIRFGVRRQKESPACLKHAGQILRLNCQV